MSLTYLINKFAVNSLLCMVAISICTSRPQSQLDRVRFAGGIGEGVCACPPNHSFSSPQLFFYLGQWALSLPLPIQYMNNWQECWVLLNSPE